MSLMETAVESFDGCLLSGFGILGEGVGGGEFFKLGR